MTVSSPTLPGTPGAALAGVWGALTAQERHLLLAHLEGGTSADWLADTLRSFGHQISPTTIRTYRRSLKGGVQS